MTQILLHTPTWVFILLAALVAFGLLQTRQRTVKKPMAYVLPLAMVVFSLSGVQSGFGLAPVTVLAWLAGLLLVAGCARRSFQQAGIGFDPLHKRFVLPGSWMPLVVILGIFLARYAIAVIHAISSAAPGTATAAVLSLLLGAFSGYFVARALALHASARSHRPA